jgi:excisionase family DNA binding protein
MATHDSAQDETSTTATGIEHGSTTNPRRAFSIREFCRQYSIGRTNAYQEIATGRLRAVKIGRRTRITHDDAEAWLAALPEFKKSKHSLTERRGNRS